MSSCSVRMPKQRIGPRSEGSRLWARSAGPPRSPSGAPLVPASADSRSGDWRRGVPPLPLIGLAWGDHGQPHRMHAGETELVERGVGCWLLNGREQPSTSRHPRLSWLAPLSPCLNLDRQSQYLLGDGPRGSQAHRGSSDPKAQPWTCWVLYIVVASGWLAVLEYSR